MELNLNFNKFKIGTLTYDGNLYTFNINKDASQMMLKNSDKVALFDTNNEGVISKDLPLVFKNFLPTEENKIEMLEQFGVNRNDGDFEKLVKIAKLNLNRDQFWISI